MKIERNKFTQFSGFNPWSLRWPRLHVLWLWENSRQPFTGGKHTSSEQQRQEELQSCAV